MTKVETTEFFHTFLENCQSCHYLRNNTYNVLTCNSVNRWDNNPTTMHSLYTTLRVSQNLSVSAESATSFAQQCAPGQCRVCHAYRRRTVP